MTKLTLHAAIVAAGITTDHHESDLYFPVSPVAVTILDGYPDHKAIAKRFVSNTDGKAWVDVPFAYEPFWQAKKETTRAAIVAKIAAEEAAPRTTPPEGYSESEWASRVRTSDYLSDKLSRPPVANPNGGDMLTEALDALRDLLAAADREDGYSEDDIDTLIGNARDIVAKHDAKEA